MTTKVLINTNVTHVLEVSSGSSHAIDILTSQLSVASNHGISAFSQVLKNPRVASRIAPSEVQLEKTATDLQTINGA